MARRVVSRVKVMASLNIAERRLPQDGRMAVNVDGRRIDLRIVTLPLADGEGIVMRILDKGPVVQDLAGLGMMPQEEESFRAALHRHRGAVLVTGPTGSGKSTTLYAAVNEVNTGDGTIITIEDPVESRIQGVKQMAVNTKVGMTFATGLRTMLRADPDIIMVGEIRDQETATIAVQAAITGHMVLSTLHTNDAPSALGRLADMGVPPFMIASAVDCIVAQRLIRKLCDACKQPVELTGAVIEQWGLQGATVYGPIGCARCGGTGYRGRIGLFEVMQMSEEIRRLAMESRSADDISAVAVREGMRSMRADGLDKVKAGLTSMVELGRVTSLV
jgi:type IV pilus assembly protein PilB